MATYLQLIQKQSRYIKLANNMWRADPDTGTAVLNDPNIRATDEDIFQYLYSHPKMTAEGRKILAGINDGRGMAINRLQSALVNPDNKNAFRDIWRVLVDASFDQCAGKNTLLYSNPGMRRIYETQAKYYDGIDDEGKKAVKDPIWGAGIDEWWIKNKGIRKKIPFVSKAIDRKIRDVAYKGTVDGVIFKQNKPFENLGDPDYFNNRNADGIPDFSSNTQNNYVAPALAAGAPVALLGGMIAPKNKLLTGLGILGAAGVAGYAYGNARKNGWNGWAPVEHGVASFNNFINKKNQ